MDTNTGKEKEWYNLDAFAKTYSSIISEGRTTCFRLSVLLCSEIDEEVLKGASEKLEKKYPFFNSELKRGLFWNYLQHKKTSFPVEIENTYPCTDIKKKNPLRIIFYKNKLSVEIAHFLTDGVGAAMFFKDLIREYLNKVYFSDLIKNMENNFPNHQENDGKRGTSNPEKKSGKYEESIEKDQYTDLYAKYMKKVNKENTLKKAFHFPVEILEKGQYYITTGEISVKDLKRESRKYKTTIGKYLLGVYFKILVEKYHDSKQQIVIGVPVDLRKIYEEETYRNFFINITPSIDPSLGDYTLEEIIEYLNNYFKIKMTKKEFYKSIYKAMNPVRNVVIRNVPYIIKRLVFPFVFDYYGERGYTTGFSNLGILDLEDKYNKYIRGFRFLPPPSRRCRIKMGIISDKEKVYVTFGNLTANHEIEKDYFVYLRKREICSRIITNYE